MVLALALVLVDILRSQEGSIWSTILRCDQILLFDHTGGIFTCDCCARDPYSVLVCARRDTELAY